MKLTEITDDDQRVPSTMVQARTLRLWIRRHAYSDEFLAWYKKFFKTLDGHPNDIDVESMIETMDLGGLHDDNGSFRQRPTAAYSTVVDLLYPGERDYRITFTMPTLPTHLAMSTQKSYTAQEVLDYITKYQKRLELD